MLTKDAYESDYRDYMNRFENGRFFEVETPEYRRIIETVGKAKECFTTHLDHMERLVRQCDPEDSWFSFSYFDNSDQNFTMSVSNKDDNEPRYMLQYSKPIIDLGDLDVGITKWELFYNGRFTDENVERFALTEYRDERSGVTDYDFYTVLYTQKMVDNLLDPSKKLENLGRYWHIYSVRIVPDIGVYTLKESVNAFESKRKTVPLSERSLRKNIRGIALRFEHIMNQELLQYDYEDFTPTYYYI